MKSKIFCSECKEEIIFCKSCDIFHHKKNFKIEHNDAGNYALSAILPNEYHEMLDNQAREA